MSSKQELLADLRAAYEEWEKFLTTAPGVDVGSRRVSARWTVKDTMAHLMAWQQLSIARVQAALLDREPQLPSWLEGADPFFADEHADQVNARIREIYDSQPWPAVRDAWHDGFQNFLELAGQLPEEKLFEAHRYPWMRGGALSSVLTGSREHHQEHLKICTAAVP